MITGRVYLNADGSLTEESPLKKSKYTISMSVLLLIAAITVAILYFKSK